VRTELVI
jgi:hypothetical protein